jgi:DNA processing protein
VGTRNATEYGRWFCEQLLERLSGFHQLQVVSGLAHGIDGIVHRCCLDLGIATVGVLGHGLDRIYPFAHRSLAEEMLHGENALLSEFSSGTGPDRENFPQRNRIVAGMCDSTLVVEAAEKGGALITAEMAIGYGRDVFALPGKITDHYSRGCNALIRDNKAALIENADDFLKHMGWDEKPSTRVRQTNLFDELSEEEKLVADQLKTLGEIHLDDLAIAMKWPVHRLSALLLGMEMKGAIVSMKGKRFKNVYS